MQCQSLVVLLSDWPDFTYPLSNASHEIYLYLLVKLPDSCCHVSAFLTSHAPSLTSNTKKIEVHMFIGWRKVLSSFVQITSSILYTMRCVFIFVDWFTIPTLQYYVPSSYSLFSPVHGDAFTLQQSMRKWQKRRKICAESTPMIQTHGQNQCCQSHSVPAGTYRICNKTVYLCAPY